MKLQGLIKKSSREVKGGIISFSRYLASYYGKYNIRVNCLSPGGIFDNQHPTFVENYENKVPMKRMGTPKDIAPPTAFLLSDDAQYITGQNLVVDGGWVCI
jgi:NAD(P)-dependent dehydrogenase (short-subunit alcohol dehydrogenase family)